MEMVMDSFMVLIDRKRGIMDYSIKMNAVNSQNSHVKAFADVTFGDCFKVTNVAVVANKEGELFVTMPRFKSKERTEKNQPVYKDICNPITAEFRMNLYGDILKLYDFMEKHGKAEVNMNAQRKAEPEFMVKVSPIEREGSNMLGLARIYFEDAFVVGNVNILRGKEAEFVAMPSHKTDRMGKDGKPVYQDVCYPVTKEFRAKLYDAVLEGYRKEKDKIPERGKDLKPEQNRRMAEWERSEMAVR